MIRIIIYIILAMTPQTESPRRLDPIPEPIVIPDPHYLYLPFVLTGTEQIKGAKSIVYGYASPHRRSYNVPFYNWGAYPSDCLNSNYWPMARGQRIASSFVESCDTGKRMLLLYNEPELGHFSATPAEAAKFVHEWRARWAGPMACCGNFYTDGGGDFTGPEWFFEFTEIYIAEYGGLPPIQAIHFHVYEHRKIELDSLRSWGLFAEAYGIPLIVSESGTFPTDEYTPEQIANRLPFFLGQLESTLPQIGVLMWFSDYIAPGALKDSTKWENSNLTTIDGRETVVGVAWKKWIEH